MNPTTRAKLAILEEAWHLRRTGLLILRSRKGGLARVAVRDGGLCRPKDADRLARAALRHALSFHPGPIDRPGDQAALGRAVLGAWRALVAVRPANLGDDQMLQLAVSPERLAGVVSEDLLDRLVRRPYAAGALVRSGAATVHELRALVGMGVLRGPEAAAVVVPCTPTVPDPWNHVPPELMAVPDIEDERPAPVEVAARFAAAAAEEGSEVLEADDDAELLALPDVDDDELGAHMAAVVRIEGRWGPLPRPGAPRGTDEEATASFRPVPVAAVGVDDDTEFINAPDDSWAEADTEETLALHHRRTAVPEELTGNIHEAVGEGPLDDALTVALRIDLINRARLELREGRWMDAARTLDRAEALGAEDPLVLIHRAWADLWLLSDPGEVEVKVQVALEGAPDDPVVAGLAHAVRARLHEEWGTRRPSTRAVSAAAGGAPAG